MWRGPILIGLRAPKPRDPLAAVRGRQAGAHQPPVHGFGRGGLGAGIESTAMAMAPAAMAGWQTEKPRSSEKSDADAAAAGFCDLMGLLRITAL